ncbi:unnamed protein product [Sphagnum jensenii]|uniref:Ubiquitin-like domain-containing protein n=1 Tax=Sphagnum jensenii TaxID=128206 RepID=A0ABP1BR58_9BRYO
MPASQQRSLKLCLKISETFLDSSKIFVKTPTGNITITLEVESSDTIANLEVKINDLGLWILLNPNLQPLFFDDVRLEDGQALDYKFRK